jgi:outer membrane protein insertion porin family
MTALLLSLALAAGPAWAVDDAPAEAVPAAADAAEAVPPAADAAEAPVFIPGTVSIVAIKGLKRVEEAAIRAAINIRRGDSLQPWMIRRDIKAIHATGFVDDVIVRAAREDGGGVHLSFHVTEKPAVRDVQLAGNKKIDEDTLLEVVNITSFTVLNRAEIKQNIQRLRDKYVEKGFYLVEIEPEIHEVGGDMVDLTFRITENRKVLVRKVEITGNDAVSDRKIKKFMRTKEAGMMPWLSSGGAFNEASLDEDAYIIRQILLEEGHVDAKVDPPQVFLSPDKRFIHVSINVEEGPRYKLGSLMVRGDYVESEGLTGAAIRQVIAGQSASSMHARWEKAAEEAGEGGTLAEGWEEASLGVFSFDTGGQPALETGDTFKMTNLQMTMQAISDLYGDQGYAFVNVVPLTEPEPEAKVVDITFDIQRGGKVEISRIDITGNDPTYDKVVRREIPINEGDIYSGSAIKEARTRLDRLGYFEEVKISTPRGAAPDTLDMKVAVVEQPTGSFSIGAGFSNLENFVFTTNVSKNNFLGLGYVMSMAANISSRQQQGNLQLFDPYFLDSRWTLRVDGYSIARQFIEDEYQRGGVFAVGRYLDARDDVRMEFNYTLEDTGLNSLDPYKKRVLGGQLYRNGLTSTGGLRLVVDKRNNRIQATKGVFSTASVDLTGGFRTDDDTITTVFGGDFNFLETKLNFRAFRPVIPDADWLIFKYNGTIGRIWSTDGTVVPYIHRYRAGGINSVRGYDWYSLGPDLRAAGYKEPGTRSTFTGSDDPTSAEDRLVVGGTETWINNFELEIPIVKQAGISTVFFFDAGNAFGDPWGVGHINPLELRTAYGMGVRWFSPMGPLRFEWGFPINPREDERNAVFDFSMGSLF